MAAEPDQQLFDDGPTSALYRRPDAAPGKAADWPPPPPAPVNGQDLLLFAQVYSGYVNSLLEAMEAPAKLSPAELHRLRAMVNRTIDGTSQHLSALQASVTEALVSKNLERMKALTAAKNSIYDKLQRMRTLLAKLPSGDAAAPIAAPGRLAGAAPLPAGAAKKSELTRAAEARQAAAAAQAAAEKAAQKAGRAERGQRTAPAVAAAYRRRPAAPASAKSAPNRVLLWLGGLVLVTIAAITYYLLTARTPETTAPSSNQPPTIKWVEIEQTAAAIVARAEADDKEHDAITFVFRWMVNGQPLEGEKSARLLSQTYREGDNVQVEIRASDGYQTGAPLVSRPLTVRAAAPRKSPQPAAREAGR